MGGPRSRYNRGMPPLASSRADVLASMTVLDEHEGSVTLGSLWKGRTAVLVFVRHFG